VKERVYINIKGLQLAEQNVPSDYDAENDDPIEVINVGSYSIVNGKEYIKYEETIEGQSKKCSGLIKIAGNTVEITKKGNVTAHLSFVPGEKTMTFYETPYGSLYLGVFARCVEMERTEDKLSIHIEYALELNYEQISECKVDIEISSKGKFSLKRN
jgi:uncharacterized beta-barrel protein YwiB (DUF1934 family)